METAIFLSRFAPIARSGTRLVQRNGQAEVQRPQQKPDVFHQTPRIAYVSHAVITRRVGTSTMLTDNSVLTNQSSPILSDPMTSPNEPPDAEPGHGTEGHGRRPQDPATRSGKSHQVELFETHLPPWELAAETSVATATVVFSEAPFGPYDYRIPDSLRETLQIGMRVRVPLGKRMEADHRLVYPNQPGIHQSTILTGYC